MAYMFKPFEKAVGTFIIIGSMALVFMGIFFLQQKKENPNTWVTFYDKGDSMNQTQGVTQQEAQTQTVVRDEHPADNGTYVPHSYSYP